MSEEGAKQNAKVEGVEKEPASAGSDAKVEATPSSTSASKSAEGIGKIIESSLNASLDFDKKWKEFQDKFDFVLKGTVEKLAESMGVNLQVRDREERLEKEKRVSVYGESQPPSLAAFAEYLLKKKKEKGKVKGIICTGAGISVAAGIPDFRSPGTGLYDNLARFNLPYPEAVFEINFFKENPKPFFMLAKELLPSNFKPTLTHTLIRLLVDNDMVLRNYTQNIDGLERIAGIDADMLVEAHGTFATARCTRCGHEHDAQYVKDAMAKDEIPRCEAEECMERGVVKPDIVFFGEDLPPRFHQLHRQDLQQADYLIVMGTSLHVYPFASLPTLCGDEVPRLLINKEEVGSFELGESSYRDVFLKGDCDVGAAKLAKALNMQKELRDMHEKVGGVELSADILAELK
eukprot:CAMPEP_0113886954 /NCGR_PEP_ID=MMETSP0780_2-20120614/11897_1 /TAXON_ID=652834 /ORGANISM="Palpitomonas bilix" /LENGTH=403 /DNA_ID=CAMNT_0000875337 /DNA_START=259 /DNA_END=1470 /DNA_ORIENTATION=+ /assembly_acc=CAM_ASM_000599